MKTYLDDQLEGIASIANEMDVPQSMLESALRKKRIDEAKEKREWTMKRIAASFRLTARRLRDFLSALEGEPVAANGRSFVQTLFASWELGEVKPFSEIASLLRIGNPESLGAVLRDLLNKGVLEKLESLDEKLEDQYRLLDKTYLHRTPCCEADRVSRSLRAQLIFDQTEEVNIEHLATVELCEEGLGEMLQCLAPRARLEEVKVPTVILAEAREKKSTQTGPSNFGVLVTFSCITGDSRTLQLSKAVYSCRDKDTTVVPTFECFDKDTREAFLDQDLPKAKQQLAEMLEKAAAIGNQHKRKKYGVSVMWADLSEFGN